VKNLDQKNKINIKRPNFLIIGSAKCGTTALASILGAHPDCCMGRPKEVCFFQDTMDFKPNSNYDMGWEWYQKAFSHYQGESVVGEATPSYSDRSRSPNTARRIAEFNPEMKIIYMVRDPLERQLSAWKMQWSHGMRNLHPDRREDKWAIKGFSYWLEHQRDAGQWDMCRYSYQLAAYREFFSDSQILVSFLEDWKQDKKKEVVRILDFLQLDPKCWDSSQQEAANRAGDRTIEKSWYRRLRSNPIVRGMSVMLPAVLKVRLFKALGESRAKPPEPDLSAAIVREFLSDVGSDVNLGEPFRSAGAGRGDALEQSPRGGLAFYEKII
jgi:hypothetical protein